MLNASKEKLASFFHGNNKYVVPFFQRQYVWGEENWDTLWDHMISVRDAYNNGQTDKEHFIGTIITKQKLTGKIGQAHYDLIDGQQRLTTIAILLKAIQESCSDELPHLKSIIDDLLFIKDAYGNREIRIIHSQIDREYFEAVLNGSLTKAQAMSKNGVLAVCIPRKA